MEKRLFNHDPKAAIGQVIEIDGKKRVVLFPPHHKKKVYQQYKPLIESFLNQP
ncbi:hypothetical protein [Spirosoma fluminis]